MQGDFESRRQKVLLERWKAHKTQKQYYDLSKYLTDSLQPISRFRS